MKPVLIALSLAAMAALGGCGEEKKAAAGATAGGEILPGSTSDAMLPLDTVRSQPPLAPKVEGTAKPGDKARGDASDAAVPADTAEPTPEPTAAAAR